MSTLKRTASRPMVEVGQHVCVDGTGKWHSGKVFFAVVTDVQPESVKIQFTDGGYKRFSKQEFEGLWIDLPAEAAVVNEVVSETFDKLPTAQQEYSRMEQLHEQIMAAVKASDFLKANKIKEEYAMVQARQDKARDLREQLESAIVQQDYLKAHEVKEHINKLDEKKEDVKQGPTFEDKMYNAGKRALGGGVSGATAMVLQVTTLMWMRTIMNYQYRNGGTFSDSYKTLMAEGGIRRLYSGLAPAMIQGPFSRFGDTFANAGVLALCESNETLNQLPMTGKTIFSSAAAAGMRIFLTPVDTVKTMMQANGKEGIPLLRAKLKAGGPGVMFHGATATMAATFVGHYPYFTTFNSLQHSVPTPKEWPKKLVRNMGIGFIAAVASDTISNSLRVVKTVRQTNATMSYKSIVSGILEKEGYQGLLGRGLKTRLLCNGCQGMMFSVVYKYVESDILGLSERR